MAHGKTQAILGLGRNVGGVDDQDNDFAGIDVVEGGDIPGAPTSAFTQTYATASKTHPAVTSLAAPAGGTGAAAGGWDTAANRDAAITAINAIRSDLTALKNLVNAVIDDLQALNLFS